LEQFVWPLHISSHIFKFHMDPCLNLEKVQIEIQRQSRIILFRLLLLLLEILFHFKQKRRIQIIGNKNEQLVLFWIFFERKSEFMSSNISSSDFISYGSLYPKEAKYSYPLNSNCNWAADHFKIREMRIPLTLRPKLAFRICAISQNFYGISMILHIVTASLLRFHEIVCLAVFLIQGENDSINSITIQFWV
jgi:hypothetical protein